MSSPAVIGGLRAEMSTNVATFVGDMGKAGAAVKGVGAQAQGATAGTRGFGNALGAIVGVAIGATLAKAATQIKLTGDSLKTTGKEAVTLADLLPAAFALATDAIVAGAKYMGEAWKAASGDVKAGATEAGDSAKEKFGDVLHFIVDATNNVIGAMVGTFVATKAIFAGIGGAMSDILIQTVNGVLKFVEDGVNGIITATNIASGGLLQLGPVAIKRVENTSAGAAKALGAAVGGAFRDAMDVDYLGKAATALIKKARAIQKPKKAKKAAKPGKSEAEQAYESLEKTLDRLERRVSKGLDELTLPKSIASANDLRKQLDDAMEAAVKAGAPVDKLKVKIAALRLTIDKLEFEGLTKEAEKFGEAVGASGRQVNEYTRGGLKPLDAAIQEVDDRYKALKTSIQEQIDTNQVLADKIPAAAAAMKTLQGQLAQLEAGHTAATAAAKAQVAAENEIADLQAKGEANEIKNQISDLEKAGGKQGVVTSTMERIQEIERDLSAQRIESLTHLRELELQKTEAERVGDTDATARLTGLIGLQQQLYTLTESTSATQIDTATRLQAAYSEFTDSLTEELSSMIADWSFDLDGIRGIFKQLAKEIFLKPVIGAASEGFGNFLSGLSGKFAGGFASGGVIPRGQWGVAGENGPEPVFAGKTDLSVVANDQQGSRVTNQVFNITTPNADSFRLGQRQIARVARQRMG